MNTRCPSKSPVAILDDWLARFGWWLWVSASDAPTQMACCLPEAGGVGGRAFARGTGARG